MNEMVGWHHRLDGHEFEQAPGVRDGQGSLVCCSPWGRKELDATELIEKRVIRGGRSKTGKRALNSGLRQLAPFGRPLAGSLQKPEQLEELIWTAVCFINWSKEVWWQGEY